jgi:AcrR family transcriptional regulator
LSQPATGERVRATKEARRQALVLAAFNQIAERGFEGLRTREVAAEVGVNIATLHYYFPTKEALIRGVVEHAMDRFRSTLAPHGSPGEQLGNHLRAVRELLLEEPQIGVVMGEISLRSARDESLAALLGEMYEGWQTTMRGLLRRGARSGDLRPELDSDDVAALVVATLSAMTLPTMTASRRTDQALRQLRRWLGLPVAKVTKQLID